MNQNPSLMKPEWAQTSNVLYFMNLPQRTSLNPAFQSSGRTYVGLPGISDISFRLDNNFLSFSDLFSGGVISDSTFTILQPGEDLDSFLAGLGDKNSLEPQAAVQLFGLAVSGRTPSAVWPGHWQRRTH